MGKELLLALGIPIAYLMVTTALLLKRDGAWPRLLQRLSARDALLWNTFVGLMIAIVALRWALQR